MKKVLSEFINRHTIFGILTSILNIVLFQVILFFSFEYRIVNFITLITVKIIAYICNKNFVFKSKCSDIVSLLKEVFRFVVARGSTMLIDFFGLVIFVDFF
jgi:hypothetical protein